MLPMLGTKVVGAMQRVSILDQALDRLVVFDRQVSTKASNAPTASFLSRPSKSPGAPRLAFDCCFFGSLFDRRPEAERAGDDREFGRHQKHAPLQIEEQLLSGLHTFAHAVDQGVFP